mgnify:CR=1 FL=1
MKSNGLAMSSSVPQGALAHSFCCVFVLFLFFPFKANEQRIHLVN